MIFQSAFSNSANPDRKLFEFSPISLWEEDFSGVKRILEDLRLTGITDLDSYLTEHPQVIEDCERAIRVLDINQRTVQLFGAASKADLLANLDKIFRGDMAHHFRDELLDIWAGKPTYQSDGINYSLNGEPIAIHLSWAVLPGYEETLERVLVATEDIRARKNAETQLQKSEAHFRGLFENAPISLWEEDFSGVKRILNRLRAEGVKDLRTHLTQFPSVVEECERAIRVVDVNRRTLRLLGANSREDLLNNLHLVFRGEMRTHFREELIDMWVGKTTYDREGINYSLTGEPIDIHLYWSVLPGYEDTLERVLVALEDITARKKAENYLKYLGTHDVLTKLFNRAFFEEEMARLMQAPPYPVSIIVADLNDLKKVNDTLGHPAGDGLIRRAAEVLNASFQTSGTTVARIGGDEFAVLLPEADEQSVEDGLNRIRKLESLNNTFYPGTPLSISLGAATGIEGSDLMTIFRLADDRMYQEKQRYHQRPG